MFFSLQAKFWGTSGRLFERDPDDDVEIDEEQLMVMLSGGASDVVATEPGCGDECECSCGTVAAKGFGFRPPKRGVTSRDRDTAAMVADPAAYFAKVRVEGRAEARAYVAKRLPRA